MKFNYLVHLDMTPFTAEISGDELSEGGAPVSAVTFTGKCRVTEKTESFTDGDSIGKRSVTILTTAGDIAPNVSELSGTVSLLGAVKKIRNGSRPRNPDGTVCFTKLELI